MIGKQEIIEKKLWVQLGKQRCSKDECGLYGPLSPADLNAFSQKIDYFLKPKLKAGNEANRLKLAQPHRNAQIPLVQRQQEGKYHQQIFLQGHGPHNTGRIKEDRGTERQETSMHNNTKSRLNRTSRRTSGTSSMTGKSQTVASDRFSESLVSNEASDI